MRLIAILACACIGLCVVDAFVCYKGICDKFAKTKPPTCKGSVVKDGGVCGCYDVCSRVSVLCIVLIFTWLPLHAVFLTYYVPRVMFYAPQVAHSRVAYIDSTNSEV